MTGPSLDGTLRAAREWLQDRLRAGEGVKCPVCTQHAKVYRRNITSRQAFTLIEVWRAAGTDWCHVPSTVTFTGDSGELSKLRYWSLVEESTEKRDDGGRAGWWRITPVGEAFIRGTIRVQKYARLYDGRLINLEGDRVSITDALGSRFDYSELMSR